MCATVPSYVVSFKNFKPKLKKDRKSIIPGGNFSTT
jgi:hypothetical protein